MKILFVCTGNTCRSPMAEHLFRKMLIDAGRTDVEVASAGVKPATWLEFPQEAREALKKEGVLNVPHKPKGVDEKLVQDSDLVIVMDEFHKKELLGRFPKAKSKVRLLDPAGIRDPYGQSQEIYFSTAELIKKSLVNLLSTLKRRP